MFLSLTVGEIFSVGGLTAILGITITFLTLILLVLSLIGMDKLLNIRKKVVTQVIPQKEQAENIADNSDKDSIVAAIMAAISVVMTAEAKIQNKAKASFVVKSIKRI